MPRVFLGFLDPSQSDEAIYRTLVSSIERAKSVVVETIVNVWTVRCTMCGMLKSCRTEEEAHRLATGHIQTGRVPMVDSSTGEEIWMPVDETS
jgi:hypothetical protein